MHSKPVTLSEIESAMNCPVYSEDYKNYIGYLLARARKVVQSVGQLLTDIQFSIDEDGCIFPFGELKTFASIN